MRVPASSATMGGEGERAEDRERAEHRSQWIPLVNGKRTVSENNAFPTLPIRVENYSVPSERQKFQNHGISLCLPRPFAFRLLSTAFDVTGPRNRARALQRDSSVFFKRATDRNNVFEK